MRPSMAPSQQTRARRAWTVGTAPCARPPPPVPSGSACQTVRPTRPHAGVDVAKAFLRDGDVLVNVYQRDGSSEAARLQGTRPLAQGLELAVLVNGGSC